MDFPLQSQMTGDEKDPSSSPQIPPPQQAIFHGSNPWAQSFIGLRYGLRSKPEDIMMDCGPAEHKIEPDVRMSEGYEQYLYQLRENRARELVQLKAQKQQEAILTRQRDLLRLQEAQQPILHPTGIPRNALTYSGHGSPSRRGPGVTQVPVFNDARIHTMERPTTPKRFRYSDLRTTEGRTDFVNTWRGTSDAGSIQRQRMGFANLSAPAYHEETDFARFGSSSAVLQHADTSEGYEENDPVFVKHTINIVLHNRQQSPSQVRAQHRTHQQSSESFEAPTAAVSDDGRSIGHSEAPSPSYQPSNADNSFTPLSEEDETPNKLEKSPKSPTLSDIIGSETPSESDHDSDFEFDPRSPTPQSQANRRAKQKVQRGRRCSLRVRRQTQGVRW